MKKVISSERIPIKMWLDDIEDGALQQAKNLANAPFTYRHIVVCPDAHQGEGPFIGAVFATKDVVVINGAGVDIGCGVAFVETSLKREDLDISILKNIMGTIRKNIPVGFDKHTQIIEGLDMPTININKDTHPVISKEFKKAQLSLMSLGGGNHFEEIQVNSAGYVCFMIHSGSRNLGKQVADHYNKIAKKLNEDCYSSVPPSHKLHFIPIKYNEAKLYLNEMNYCLEYAHLNREYMINNIKNVFLSFFPNLTFTPTLNVHHNYIRWEHFSGEDFLIHRKGATSARLGELGIVPGSQGTASFLTKGKGNVDSFNSCSHGSGRIMSRTRAKAELDLEKEKKILDDQGIIHSIRNVSDLDEAPSSYKDVEVVMENQKDLVDIVDRLRPMAVIKG